MSDALSYNEALTILGRTESRLVSALDEAATVGLAVWATTAAATGSDLAVPLGLRELKDDIVKYSYQLLRRVTEWRKGISRFDRSQRLAATPIVRSRFTESTFLCGICS